MTDLPDLVPDCSACAALCCVGLAFDKGPDFAIDKPAGTPCPHLDAHSCRIHADLGRRGFGGCAAYGCDGAGQRTVALHGGASWQDDPALLAPMLETFRHLRVLHQLVGLLNAAAALPLPPEAEADRTAYLAQLCPDPFDARTAQGLATGPLPGAVRGFIRSLSAHCAPLQRGGTRNTSLSITKGSQNHADLSPGHRGHDPRGLSTGQGHGSGR